ncbi:MAG TPA: peptidoglycan-associated lipoprotein Pal [Gemmatimonadaceae bacterium]|nr:peptidoglycan-associated lipoprotein Pal [Gemmatimonadaceae bacterium]
MRVTSRLTTVALALVSVALLDACRRTPPPPVEPVEDTAAIRIAREDSIRREQQRLADEAAARQRAIQDSINRARAAAEDAQRASDMLRGTLVTGITFDFDRSDLRDDARATLDAKVPILMANSNVTIRIAGHADERGSSEYNLALGQRRAAAAKRYLVERGIAEGRIETTSFGEERPACTESNEGCWSQNRRDEFEMTSGGAMLRSGN